MTPSESLSQYARDLDAAYVRFTRSHSAAGGDMIDRHDLSYPCAMLACAVRNRELGARASEIVADTSSNVIALRDYAAVF
jgi:hypothetical protein